MIVKKYQNLQIITIKDTLQRETSSLTAASTATGSARC